jgi:thiol-disulfide isomerase/thioredoxin
MRVLLPALLFFCACVKAPPTTPVEPPLALELPRHPDGTTWKLSEERGRVVLLDVWATWCEACRDSLPLYQQLVAKHAAQGVVMYALNIDGAPSVPDIGPFLSETKVTAPVLRDEDARVSETLLKVNMLPSAVLLDRQGRLRHHHQGFEDGSLEAVERQLVNLLAEPVP